MELYISERQTDWQRARSRSDSSWVYLLCSYVYRLAGLGSNALGFHSIAKIQRRCCCRPSNCRELSVEVEGNFVFEEVKAVGLEGESPSVPRDTRGQAHSIPVLCLCVRSIITPS